uniref:FAM13A-like domain-containing protein n=1 Tax=Lotharella globosa TaxID=91324 RepID=A0A7S3YJN6_9EUKA
MIMNMTLMLGQRDSGHRPQKIAEMTLSQLQEDKAFLKRLLNGLDKAFKQKNGRLPTKQEKEVYRPIYEEYRKIKDTINNHPAQNQHHAASSLSDMTLQRMKSEKRALQIHLNKFEKSFRMRNGRKIQYQRDIISVKSEYERYMQLKAALAAHSQTSNRRGQGSRSSSHHSTRMSSPDSITAITTTSTATSTPLLSLGFQSQSEMSEGGQGSIEGGTLASPLKSSQDTRAETDYVSFATSPRDEEDVWGDRRSGNLRDQLRTVAAARGEEKSQ